MEIEIIDAGSTLKIKLGDSTRIVPKHTIKGISIVGEFLKLNTNACCSPYDYLAFADVTNPAAPSLEALRDQVGDMLQSSVEMPEAAGLSTEAKQTEAIGKLTEIKTAVENSSSGKATALNQETQTTALTTLNTTMQGVGNDINNAVINASSGKATAGNQLNQQTALENINTTLGNMLAGQATGLNQLDQKAALNTLNETVQQINTAVNTVANDKATASNQLTLNDTLGTLNDNVQGVTNAINTAGGLQSTAANQVTQNTTLSGLLTSVNAMRSAQATSANQTNLYNLLWDMQGRVDLLLEWQLFSQLPARIHVNSTHTYEGFCLPGTNDEDSAWAIRQKETINDGDSTITLYRWAEGTRERNYMWTDRESLGYY